MFEKASRAKLRFNTNQGQLSVEDLWDLSLNSLDTLAKNVNKQLREEGEESFIPSRNSSRPSTNNSLRLDLLKHIIGIKVEEQEKKKNRVEMQGKLAKLKELAETKVTEKLASQSLEDIYKQISELESTLV